MGNMKKKGRSKRIQSMIAVQQIDVLRRSADVQRSTGRASAASR